MIQWLDHPFIDLIRHISSMLPYFMTQARAIARLLLLISLFTTFLKYAISHNGLKEDLVKIATAYILFSIFIGLYPKVINGINSIAYKWTMNSTYSTVLAETIDKTKNDNEFWTKKGNKADSAYSDIIKKVEVVDGEGQVGYKYILDLYLEDTGYMSPSAMMRVILLIGENILDNANKASGFSQIKEWILGFLTFLCVLISGILAACQYFVGVLEFQFIVAVGVFTLPGMLWNGTKFLTEKFIGAIFGQFIKMLFVGIAVMLMFNGMLLLMTREYTGALDQIVYTVFICILYWTFCQHAPQLAVSLLTGTPQMSLMEVAASAAMFGGAAYGSAKAATTGAMSVAGGGAKTIGSAITAGGNAYQSAGGGMKGVAAAIGGGTVGALASAGHSIAKTVGSVTNQTGKVLTGRQTENQHSSLEKFRTGRGQSSGGQAIDNKPRDPVADARSNTGYIKAKWQEGTNFAKNMFKSQPGSSSTSESFTSPTTYPQLPGPNQSYLPPPNGPSPGLLPPGSPSPIGLPPTTSKLALPSSTPSRLLLEDKSKATPADFTIIYE